MIPVSKPYISEDDIDSINRVVASGWISSNSPVIKKFENNWHSIHNKGNWLAVCNATNGLEIALRANNIGVGSKVLVPDITFAASINAILNVGAKPLICPVDKNLLIDLDIAYKTAKEYKADALLAVGLYNKTLSVEKLKKFSKDNISVICDWAEVNPLSKNSKEIWNSFTTVYSFFANKFITTGEGGICGFPSKKLYNTALLIRDHGMDPDKRYWHKIQGMNCRMTAFQAALGISQLSKLDFFINDRNRIFSKYKELLSNIEFIELDNHLLNNDPPWLNNIFLLPKYDETYRNKIITKLFENNIESRPVFYPLQSMPLYKNYKVLGLDYSDSQKALRGISLPTFVGLEDNKINHICKTLEKILKLNNF